MQWQRSKNWIHMIFTLGFLLMPILLHATDEDKIKRGIKRLNELIEKNAANDARGESYLNEYIFSLEEDPDPSHVIIIPDAPINVPTTIISELRGELAALAKDKNIHFYIALNGSLLSVGKLGGGNNSYHGNENTFVAQFWQDSRTVIKNIHTNSHIGAAGGGRNVLLGITPVEIVELDPNTGVKDKLYWKYLRVAISGKAYPYLIDIIHTKSLGAYSTDAAAAIRKDKKIFTEVLENYDEELKALFNEDIYKANLANLKLKLNNPADLALLEDLCKNIALLNPSVLKSYNNWAEGVNSTNNNIFGFHSYGDYKLSEADIKGMKAVLEKFKAGYSKFIDAHFADAAAVVDCVNENFTSKGSQFNAIATVPFQNLSLANRKALLKLLTEHPSELIQRSSVIDRFETLDIIQELLANATSADAWSCLVELEKDDRLFQILSHSYDLLYFVQGKFHAFTELIGKIAVENNSISNDGEKVGKLLFKDRRELFVDDSYLGNFNKENLNEETKKIEVAITNGPLENFVDDLSKSSTSQGNGVSPTSVAVTWLFNPGYGNRWEGSVAAKPLEHVAIIPVKDIIYGNQIFEKGKIYVLPSVTVFAIFKEDTKTALGTSTKLAINIGFTFIGVNALNVAFQASAEIALLQTGELTLGVGAAILNSIPEVSQDHPDFVEYYNYATIVYVIAKILPSAYKGVKTLKGRPSTGVSTLENAIIANVEYNKILSDLKNGIISPKYSNYGVLIEEEAALRYYTTEAYADLNKALRGEAELTKDLLAQERLMNSAIDKLPKVQGKEVYRGLGKAETDFAKQLKVGDEFTNKDFTSTSLKAAIAEDFATENVLYVISPKSGVNIKDISVISREAEVLLKSGARFKVTDISFKPRFEIDDPVIKWISLDEL